jgi:hypothetical protein
MPRRRNNENLIIFDETTLDYDIQEPIRPVKDYLKNQVWELIKSKQSSTTSQEKDNKIECSICLDDICCQKCYTILTCGHSYHLSCVIKCKTCPLCRN